MNSRHRRKRRRASAIFRNEQTQNLREKYISLWMDLYAFEGDIDYGVANFMMSQLLTTGQISAFHLELSEQVERQLGLADFVEKEWDWANRPIYARPVTIHNSPLIPKRTLEVNKDIVIMKLQFLPIRFIDEYVERIVDVESTIRTNLLVNKMPFAVTGTDVKTINAVNRLLDDEEVVFIEDPTNMISVIDTKAPLIIQELQQYRLDLEAELLTILGIDAVKVEKRAQQSIDEVNANNEEINAYQRMVQQRLEKFFEKIKEVLGFDIQIKKKPLAVQSLHEYEEDEYYDIT